jgi:polyphosphate kinase 2 (PPK2 family)
MLEKIDLSQKISKKTYKIIQPEMRERLYQVQKLSWDAGLPVVILFEGWDAAGKGTSIQALTTPLDPRGYKLYPIRAARTYEKKRPWLWRFWLKLPARGEWALFDRSWYGRVLVERVEGLVPEEDWRRAYRDIVDFERTISDDGCTIIKFFLHISKGEQKKRFEKLVKDPLAAWHVTPEDWQHHRNYDDWLLAYEECFEHTDSEWGPWTIVEATDRRFTRIKILQTVIRTMEERLGLDNGPLPSLEEGQEEEELEDTDEDEDEVSVVEIRTEQPSSQDGKNGQTEAPSSTEAQGEDKGKEGKSDSEVVPS